MATINILITIATDRVKKISNPSQNPQQPTGIAHDLGYMVGTSDSDTTTFSGQGTGDLVVSALVGDTVRAWATSGSDNFDDAVLLYGMPKFKGDDVTGPFQYKMFRRSTVVPQNESQPLPARIVEEDFWFFQSELRKKGTEQYKVQFALYKRGNDGNPLLVGYFEWDPTFTARG